MKSNLFLYDDNRYATLLLKNKIAQDTAMLFKLCNKNESWPFPKSCTFRKAIK